MRTAAGVAAAVVGGLLAGCGGDASSDQDRQQLAHFTAEITTYTVVLDHSIVTMGVVPVPPGAGVDLVGVDGVVSNVSGHLEESSEIEYDGYAGRDARITTEYQGDQVTAFTRILDINGSLLHLLNVVRTEVLKEPPESWTDMLASLEIG